MPREDRKLLQGTLDILILKTLSWGPMHGYGIASWIEQQTKDTIQVEEGSLYPALHRMERKGWITSDWQLTENRRRAKLYQLTRAGRRQLLSDLSEWTRFAGAVAAVLNGTDAPAWAR
jgi:transcriptional regulator